MGCRPKVHDVFFHDKVEKCPYCGIKLYPVGIQVLSSMDIDNISFET